MMRSLAPVRVRRVETDVWDAPDLSWLATCRVCSDYLAADTHAEALAWAHGHMHVRHPGWGRPRTTRCERITWFFPEINPEVNR